MSGITIVRAALTALELQRKAESLTDEAARKAAERAAATAAGDGDGKGPVISWEDRAALIAAANYPVRVVSAGADPSLMRSDSYYRDDLDAESVRLLALHARQQLSIQALSIANADALDVISLFRDRRDIRLM